MSKTASTTPLPGYISSTKQRGAALIMVLTTLLALSVVVLEVSQRVTRQSMNSSLLLLEYGSSLPARAGLEIGLDILSNMPENSLRTDPKGWNAVWREKGLTVKIFPCAARLNLNGLGNKGRSGKRFTDAILDILATVDLSVDELNSLRHWTGTLDSEQQGSIPGRMPELHSPGNPGYKAPQRNMARPEELMLVPGFEDLEPGWIRQRFTVWGDQTGIDINFADQEIVLALLPELESYWERLDSYRQKQGITHPNQLLENIGLDIATYNTVLPHIILKPEVFEIIIEVREGSWYEQHRYIVKKNMINPDQPPKVMVRDVLETKPL